MNLKIWLWKIGLLKEKICPICKSKLTEHYNDKFSCPKKGCEFNKGDR